jgi:hypothetical protein
LGGGQEALHVDNDTLVGIAEVAIVFAGFAGVSVVLSRRQPDQWTYAEAARMSCMIESSLTAAFFALLPILFISFNVSFSTTWAVCSAGLALVTMQHMIITGVRMRRAYSQNPEDRMPLLVRGTTFVVGLSVVIVLALNALGMAFPRVAGPFFAGLLFHLVFAGFMFTRSLTLLRGTSRGDRC